MAIDEADESESGHFDSESATGAEAGGPGGARVSVGTYSWADFMVEHGFEDQVDPLYENDDTNEGSNRLGLGESGPYVPSDDDWDRVAFDPEEFLGFHPDDVRGVLAAAAEPATEIHDEVRPEIESKERGVTKDFYTRGKFEQEHSGSLGDYLDFAPEHVENELAAVGNVADRLGEVVDDRTVDIEHENEDDFFSTEDGRATVVDRYDLEKAVPVKKKTHFREEQRYWVNKPYSFVIIFHSEKENEKKYYAVEPHLNEIEVDLKEFLTGKLRTGIKYSDDEIVVEGTDDDKKDVIERETKRLLRRYDLYDGEIGLENAGKSDGGGILSKITGLFGGGDESESAADEDEELLALDGASRRPEPVVLEEDPDTLNAFQVERLLYLLKRDFIGYERIDPIKHDINVEDISCDGYHSPVFVYHSDYEQIITNIYHGENELDDFVVKLAQRSGKGISKRRPQVDATLPDGSRSQLTLGREVSDHGTNYTIRQFKDVPFTPIDLINWNTFSLDEMAFLWLCIENHKSLIFAGGTASGKTTSLNAVSLFIPSNTKIVSIEDTREVELPQRNWIASVTRPSFGEDDTGDVDEFDLLEAALRQRPDYIVMGEIRGEEGRTLFQVMSTGHTTYTTFHADSVGEVLKRFTTDPINVSKTMFTALDLVSIQTQTRVQGHKVRRNKSLTEINHYDAENDEINVQDVYQWQAETDEFLKMGDSNTLEDIKFDRGWSQDKLESELFKRRVVLAYLIDRGLNDYTRVAATFQAFINDPDTILTLIAEDVLEESLEDLREMESVLIEVDAEKEALVPRPDPDDETANLTMDILERAEDRLFDDYRGRELSGLDIVDAIEAEEAADPAITPDSAEPDEFDFEGEVDDESEDDDFDLGDDQEEGFSFDTEVAEEEDVEEGPDWLSADGDFDLSEESGATTDEVEEVDEDLPELLAADEDDADGSGPGADDTSETDDGFVMGGGDDESDEESTPAGATASTGGDAEAAPADEQLAEQSMFGTPDEGDAEAEPTADERPTAGDGAESAGASTAPDTESTDDTATPDDTTAAEDRVTDVTTGDAADTPATAGDTTADEGVDDTDTGFEIADGTDEAGDPADEVGNGPTGSDDRPVDETPVSEPADDTAPADDASAADEMFPDDDRTADAEPVPDDDDTFGGGADEGAVFGGGASDDSVFGDTGGSWDDAAGNSETGAAANDADSEADTSDVPDAPGDAGSGPPTGAPDTGDGAGGESPGIFGGDGDVFSDDGHAEPRADDSADDSGSLFGPGPDGDSIFGGADGGPGDEREDGGDRR